MMTTVVPTKNLPIHLRITAPEGIPLSPRKGSPRQRFALNQVATMFNHYNTDYRHLSIQRESIILSSEALY